MIAVATIGGCRTAAPAPEAAPGEPSATLDKFEWKGTSLMTATASVRAVVDNPTAADVTVKSAHVELFIEGQQRLAKDLPLAVVAPAGGAAKVEFEEDVTVFTDGDDLLKHVTGEVVPAGATIVLTLSSGAKLALKSDAAVRQVRLPVAEMSHIEAYRTDGGAVALTFYPTIDNQNPFAVRLKGFSFTAIVDGHVLSQGETAVGDKLPASSKVQYEIAAPLTADTYGKELAAALKRGGLKYEVSGEIEAGAVTVPVHLAGDLPVH